MDDLQVSHFSNTPSVFENKVSGHKLSIGCGTRNLRLHFVVDKDKV